MINQIASQNNFSNLYEIPIENDNPNFTFNIQLSNENFDITFKTIKDEIFVSIVYNDVFLLNNANIKFDIALNYTSLYLFDKGLFFFTSSIQNIKPSYLNFNKYIKFYYGEF